MEKPKFVPIDEASTNRVTIALPLPPFLDFKRIGFDTRRTEHLMDLGAIKTLHINGMDEEVLGEEPVIVGVNSRGEAVAAKKGRSQLFLFMTENRGNIKINPKSMGKYILIWMK